MRAGGNTVLLGTDGSAAILIDDDRAESFADGIAALCSNAERGRLLAEAARKRLIEEFPLARMIDAYDGMMQTLVGKAAIPE